MKRLLSIFLAVGVVGLLIGAVSFNNPTPGQLVVFHDANTFTNAANTASGVFNGITNYGVMVNTPQLSTVGTAVITGTNYWYVQTSSNITLTLSGTAVEGQFVTFDVSNSAVTNINVALSPSVWEPASGLLLSSISVTATNEEALQFSYRGGRWKMFHDGFQHTLAAGWGSVLETNISAITISPTNRLALIPTNATSVTVDFSDVANFQEYGTWFHLTTNLVVSPTNLVVGRTLKVRFPTNSLTYDVTFTNTAAVPVRWNFNVATNGSTSFTKTNTIEARVYITAETNGVISAEMGYYR